MKATIASHSENSGAMIHLPADALEDFVLRILKKHAVSNSEAEAVASHLVDSNLMGHDSHGVIRLPWYLEKIQKGELVPGAPIEIIKETPSSAVVDGHWGFGQVIARFAMELAIQKAESHVVSCVTVRNCNHVGRLGAYTSLASEKGMIGIGMANLHGTSHCVVPFGGRDTRLPTNPISIALPSGRIPDFLLDMTTSVAAEGKIRLKMHRGEFIPEGWIIDSEGHPTTDPRKFYEHPRGALLPLGGIAGHKGFALSMAVDAMSGALSGADCSNPASRRHGNACVFIAIRIEAFIPLETFESKVNTLVEHAKSSRLAEGSERILMPGEPEYLSFEERKREGITLESLTWEAICRKARECGVPIPSVKSISAGHVA